MRTTSSVQQREHRTVGEGEATVGVYVDPQRPTRVTALAFLFGLFKVHPQTTMKFKLCPQTLNRIQYLT